MSNTIDGNLSNSQLSANAIPTSQPKVCPLANIATQLYTEGPTRTGVVSAAFVTATSATAANVSSYQTGDTTVGRVAITVNHLAKRSHFACPENNKGLTPPAHIMDALVREYQKDVFALVSLNFTAAAFGAADLTSALADFDTTDLEALGVLCNGYPRTALLAAGAMPGCANDLVRDAGKWSYPLFDGVYEVTLGGDADVCAVVAPTAFGFINEKPLSFSTMPADKVTISEIVLPQLQIKGWSCQWYDLASRAWWLSVEGCFGVAVADATALTFAKSS